MLYYSITTFLYYDEMLPRSFRQPREALPLREAEGIPNGMRTVIKYRNCSFKLMWRALRGAKGNTKEFATYDMFGNVNWSRLTLRRGGGG